MLLCSIFDRVIEHFVEVLIIDLNEEVNKEENE